MSEQQSDFMQGFYRGRAEGVIVEQERIIKLLETYVGLTGMFGLERDDLIALVKGENK